MAPLTPIPSKRPSTGGASRIYARKKVFSSFRSEYLKYSFRNPESGTRRNFYFLRIEKGRKRQWSTREKRASIGGSNSHGTGTQSDRKSTRLNSSHLVISYAVFCL